MIRVVFNKKQLMQLVTIKFKMARRKCNLCTLRPKEKTDRALFWKFRNDDIVDMFWYYLAFQTIICILFLLNYITSPSTGLLLTLIFHSVVYVPRFLVWLLGSRIKQYFVYSLLALNVAT